MKKNLLAMAVLGVAAGTASAQNSLTIYGLVDIGIAFERGGADGSVTRLDGSDDKEFNVAIRHKF